MWGTKMVNMEHNSSKSGNNIPVRVSDFAKVCRTCLTTENITPISLLKHNETSIVSFLDSCASIHVEEDDCLPQNLCSVCLQEIIKIHLFQEKCKQNDNLLRVVLAEPEVVKVELDDKTIKQEEIELPTIYSESDSNSNKTAEEKKTEKENSTFAYGDSWKEFAEPLVIKQEVDDDEEFEMPNSYSDSSDSETNKITEKTYTPESQIIKEENNTFFFGDCSKEFASSADKFEKKVEEVREHVCEICKKAYKTKLSLKKHLVGHGEKKFLCSYCDKGFARKEFLQSHLRVHTGEKPYVCKVCKKSFAHDSSFRVHILTHTGEKPFRCKICARDFTQKFHLRDHMRTHSGEKPYSCTYCEKRFALKGNLTVHIRTHTGETPYVCVCGKGFYESSRLKRHQKSRGGACLQQSGGVNVVVEVSEVHL